MTSAIKRELNFEQIEPSSYGVPKGYMTIEEVSEFIKIPVKTLRKIVHSRKLKVYQPGRRLLFKIEDIESFIQRHPFKPKKLGATNV